MHRSSCQKVFLRKVVLKIRSKFTGENPCQSVILINLLNNFIEITLWHGCSPVNLPHIFRTLFIKNTSGQLLLNAAFNYLQKKVIQHQSRISVSCNKESENKKLPSKWTLFALLMFSLLHSMSICPIFASNLLQTHNILLKQFSFYLSQTYFFLSNQDRAPFLKITYIFKVFGAQSCLMVAQQFDQMTYVYEECNNFQDSKLIFMILKFSQ